MRSCPLNTGVPTETGVLTEVDVLAETGARTEVAALATGALAKVDVLAATGARTEVAAFVVVCVPDVGALTEAYGLAEEALAVLDVPEVGVLTEAARPTSAAERLTSAADRLVGADCRTELRSAAAALRETGVRTGASVVAAVTPDVLTGTDFTETRLAVVADPGALWANVRTASLRSRAPVALALRTAAALVVREDTRPGRAASVISAESGISGASTTAMSGVRTW